MSECQEKHTVARLIGSPPGYVGFEQGGLLTDSIRKNSHAVLLLDEVEKAHADIFNTLLQDKIKTWFVDEVLFGRLSNGGTVVADIKNGDVVLTPKK